MSFNDVVEEPSDAPSLSEYVAFTPNAYRNRALALISHCRYCSAVSEPRSALQDNELRRVLEVCNNAVHSAAHAGENVTNEADKRFKLAVQALERYRDGFVSRGHRRNIVDMGLAEQIDVSFSWMDEAKDEWPISRIPVNFVIFKTLPDPKPTIIQQMLDPIWAVPEALWNFSCFKDNRRITLQQNPQFYEELPMSSDAYQGRFKMCPIENFWGVKRDATIYVLVDQLSRVFLKTKQGTRLFGKVFTLKDVMIFRDTLGVLWGEMALGESVRGTPHIWYSMNTPLYQAPSARPNHQNLPPIVTAAVKGKPVAGGVFGNWRDSVRQIMNFHDIDLYISTVHVAPDSTENEILPPLPPISEQPTYRVLYRPLIDILNNDALLEIFNHDRLDDEEDWNVQFRWSKLSHVCRRWRYLIYESSSYLKMQLLLTNGDPIADMLANLPPLPLVIGHGNWSATITAEEERGILLALQQYDRIRRVVLQAPSPGLHKLLVTMDKPFAGLEHLSLLSTTEEDTRLTLPNTFLAPNLRHLTLFGVSLPTGMPLLVSTVALATLTLTHIGASGYFPPEHLVTRLQFLPHLEELSIGFSTPVPRPSAEKELLRVPITRVTLPALERLMFRGVGAYLESLVVRIITPVLDRLSITLFNQISYTLPHLSYFAVSTEGLRYPVGKVIFGKDAVSIVTGHRDGPSDENFNLSISCKEVDWQMDSATRVCRELMPVFYFIEELTFGVDELRMPSGAEWQDNNNSVDNIVWHELLLPFNGVRKLCVDRTLALELSSALELDEAGLVPGLLPELQEIEVELENEQANNAFARFVEARQLAGRPVRLQALPVLCESPTEMYQDKSLPTESSLLIPNGPWESRLHRRRVTAWLSLSRLRRQKPSPPEPSYE